jgi:pilus assembly protein CpaB
MLGGVVLSVIWFNQIGTPTVDKAVVSRPAVMVATHPISAGTLLRSEDIAWKETGPGDVKPGNVVRGQMSDAEFFGAITRRDFAGGEQLIVSELVRPNERQFLAAVLKPGTRAVSISLDVPQSATGMTMQGAAGLVLPGDYVDVILTQTFEDAAVDATHKTVAETVMRDVQIIAVDQSLGSAEKAAPHAAMTPATAPRAPKTVTFALTEKQAERMFVAMQLGRLQLSVRPLEGRNLVAHDDNATRRPTWASDVSTALNNIARKDHPAVSSVEKSVRRPPMMPSSSLPSTISQAAASQ